MKIVFFAAVMSVLGLSSLAYSAPVDGLVLSKKDNANDRCYCQIGRPKDCPGKCPVISK